MTKKWIIIEDIDCSFYNVRENFEEMLEQLTKEAPSAFVKVVKAHGPGGGWPQCQIVVLEDELNACLEFFGFDEYDIEMYREEFMCEFK
jgi:hypothetical protein